MQTLLKKFLFGPSQPNETLINVALLLLRVFTGLALCTIFEKFLPRDGIWGPQAWFVEDVARMGFPAPVFFAWAAVLAEFFGGLLLIIGLFSRPAALLNVIVMIVATFLQNGGDISNKGLMSFTFLVLCLTLLLSGAGKYSLDYLISRRTTAKQE